MLCDSCATMGASDPMRIRLHAGQALLCRHGSIWVTRVAADGRVPVADIVMAPGDRLLAEQGAEYVVSPLGRRAARVCIARRPGTGEQRPARPHGWRRWTGNRNAMGLGGGDGVCPQVPA